MLCISPYKITNSQYPVSIESLIGSAVERVSLLNEIDDAHLRCLATDQEKDKKKLQEENESKRLLHLMNCRIERLAEEPSLSGTLMLQFLSWIYH